MRQYYEPWTDLKERYDALVERLKEGDISPEGFRKAVKNYGFNATEIAQEISLHAPKEG